MIRKWRFISFTKKMARRKLELMYKNLHASYMQMADEIFGDDEINPSVIKEFEMFGNNVGMFTGQEPEVSEDLNRRYYTTVEKKYVFKSDAPSIPDLRKSYNRQKIIMKQEIEEEKEAYSERKIVNRDLGHSYRVDSNKDYKKKYFKREK